MGVKQSRAAKLDKEIVDRAAAALQLLKPCANLEQTHNYKVAAPPVAVVLVVVVVAVAVAGADHNIRHLKVKLSLVALALAAPTSSSCQRCGAALTSPTT